MPDLRTYRLICCVTAVLLGVALAPLPYGYYQLLRFAVCGAAIYAAFCTHEYGKSGWPWVFVAVAVLFNPILPIYLGRSAWKVADVAAGVVFLVSAAAVRPPRIDRTSAALVRASQLPEVIQRARVCIRSREDQDAR